ncbi:MAG: prolyl oligopeptidase family serine peptidase [Polyangiales bacterium]
MTEKRPVTDVYHGESIVDSYRWLEDGASPEVSAWTAAQNEKTRSYLDGPLHDKLRARIDELLQIGFVSSGISKTGTSGSGKKQPRRYFHVRREGTQDQPIVYVREGLDGKDRVLLDPTKLGTDKTSALDWWYLSPDGSKVVYGVSRSGDEDSTLHLRDVATGEDGETEIPRTRMTSVSWFPDGSGFFYTREPEPGTVPKGEEHYHRTVHQHRLGRHWKHDERIFPAEGDTQWKMTDIPTVQVSPSGKWLLVRVHHAWGKSSVLLQDLATKTWKTIVTGVDAQFDPVFHRRGNDESIFMRSNEGAPNFEIFRIDPKKPEKTAWKKIVPEGADALRDFDTTGDTLFLSYLHRASSRIERRTLEGKLVEEIALPVLGTASVPSGDLDGDDALFEVQSYGFPPTIYRIDLKKKAPPTVFAKIDVKGMDPSSIAVDQIEAKSKDGTIVTAFVVHRKDVGRDGKAPGILYGYGGFNISQTPAFNRTVYAFLEKGGVYVVANLRGGAEYGEKWHKAGMLGNKQNVFDAAIAVAEKLVADHWGDGKRLGVLGGSNGGLLVGALITQRPELFRAAVSAVPLLDMLRFQQFLIAKLWVPEYGSSDDPEQYKWLRAYSPYHHVKDGTAYPATLFMTAESDARVDPMHARKMAARMQEATSSGKPILLRVETKAGHGVGKPRFKQVEELADEWTFLFRELALTP